MNKKKIKKLIARARPASRLIAYLLPAIVLSLSLASSLLVAGGTQGNTKGGIVFMGSFPSPTPLPSPTPSPQPFDQLSATVNTADGAMLNAATGVLSINMGRLVLNHPPVMTPDPLNKSTTMGVPIAFLLPLSDAESNRFTATLVRTTGNHGGTAILTGNDLVGYMLHYTPLGGFTGVEKFLIQLQDQLGLTNVVTVLVTVS